MAQAESVWFSGTIVEAIAAAKSQSSFLVVFIFGKDQVFSS
jgi:hypothetical protein